MDNFDFIFNGDKLFDFSNLEKKAMENLKRQEEESMNLNTAMGNLKQSQNESNEIEMLKHEMHVKNKIILNILEENKAYSELIRNLVEKAETIPGTEKTINDVMKDLNMRAQMNNLLKMAIEAEESFDF